MDIIKNTVVKVELRSHEYDYELKELLRLQLCSILVALINIPVKYNEVKISLSSQDFSSEIKDNKIFIKAKWEYFTDTNSPFFKLGISRLLKLIDDGLVIDDDIYDKLLSFDGNEEQYSLISFPIETSEKSILKLIEDYTDSSLTILNKNKDYLFSWKNFNVYFDKTKEGYVNKKICIL